MTDSDNGKVTLAVLGNKIDNQTKQIESLTTALDTVHANQIAISRIEAEQKNQCKDIGDLENRVNGWSAINSVGALVAAIVGIFVNPNR